MNTSDIDIFTLIPQRPPIVMVDRLEHYDPVDTVTSLTVQPGNLFVENGRLTAYGITENIAQTCAARIGYMNRMAGDAVRIGVIGAIRDLRTYSLPPVGARLTTRITLLEEVFQMTLVEARVEYTTPDCKSAQTAATATMKIALT